MPTISTESHVTETHIRNLMSEQPIELDHLGSFRIEGDDANDFLQGQFSNDLTTLQIGTAHLNGYCNPKGRLLAVFWLARESANQFVLFLPKDIAKATVMRLKMFVLRAKVTITELNQTLLAHTTESHDTANDQLFIRLQHPADFPIHLQLVDQCPTNCLPNSAWHKIDILAGVGMVYAQTVESFIPQMINLDLAQGVSFTKGCYPGQEIIARLRYLGKLKQRAIAAVISSESVTEILPGNAVSLAEKPEKKSGEVINAVKIADLTWWVLAMVPSTHLYEGDLQIDGNPLQRVSLPYDITVEKPKGRTKV